MKKLFMILAASMLLFACGGNNKKAEDPYTKHLDQALKALRAGDVEKADQIGEEYEEWVMSLDEAEMQKAFEAAEKWVDKHGDEMEELYIKYSSEGDDEYEDYDDGYYEAEEVDSSEWDEIIDEYEELIDEYIDVYQDAMGGDMDAMTELAELSEELMELAEEIDAASDEMTVAQATRIANLSQKLANAVQ